MHIKSLNSQSSSITTNRHSRTPPRVEFCVDLRSNNEMEETDKQSRTLAEEVMVSEGLFDSFKRQCQFLLPSFFFSLNDTKATNNKRIVVNVTHSHSQRRGLTYLSLF